SGRPAIVRPERGRAQPKSARRAGMTLVGQAVELLRVVLAVEVDDGARTVLAEHHRAGEFEMALPERLGRPGLPRLDEGDQLAVCTQRRLVELGVVEVAGLI